MDIPLSYSFRNLMTRRLTTALTAGGMALVVFVFAAMLMLAEGFQHTLVETGRQDNVVTIRKSSMTEIQSGIDRSQAAIVGSMPDVATDASGMPLFARECVVLISLPKRSTGKQANVTIRGIADASVALRPQARIIAGRLPAPGSSEIAAGRSIASGFTGGGLGESVRFGGRDWRVVGVFDAGDAGFSSEIWADVDQIMQAFRRPVYSSTIFRLRDSAAFDSVKSSIESDPRLTLEAKRETTYYRDQSEMMAKFLRILGTAITIIFSLGAIIGAMITMHAAVAGRVVEIGTLRALGFRRHSILAAFVAESLMLGAIGGVTGLLAATSLQLLRVSTMNFQTFAEIAFSFSLTPGIIVQCLGFSLFMGLLGGILPAWRASRLAIVDALRSA